MRSVKCLAATALLLSLALGVTGPAFSASNELLKDAANREMIATQNQITSDGLDATLSSLESRFGAPAKILSRMTYTNNRGYYVITYTLDFTMKLLTVTARDRKSGAEGIVVSDLPEQANAPASGDELVEPAIETRETQNVQLRAPVMLESIFGAQLVPDAETGKYYTVTNLISGRSADKAGLRNGDVILILNGQVLVDAPESRVVAYITSLSGKRVQVLFRRGNTRRTVSMLLG